MSSTSSTSSPSLFLESDRWMANPQYYDYLDAIDVNSPTTGELVYGYGQATRFDEKFVILLHTYNTNANRTKETGTLKLRILYKNEEDKKEAAGEVVYYLSYTITRGPFIVWQDYAEERQMFMYKCTFDRDIFPGNGASTSKQLYDVLNVAGCYGCGKFPYYGGYTKMPEAANCKTLSQFSERHTRKYGQIYTWAHALINEHDFPNIQIFRETRREYLLMIERYEREKQWEKEHKQSDSSSEDGDSNNDHV